MRRRSIFLLAGVVLIAGGVLSMTVVDSVTRGPEPAAECATGDMPSSGFVSEEKD